MEEIHVTAKRIGNSWGIIIPKPTANNLKLNGETELHVNLERAPSIKELIGTFKGKVTIEELKAERKSSWKE